MRIKNVYQILETEFGRFRTGDEVLIKTKESQEIIGVLSDINCYGDRARLKIDSINKEHEVEVLYVNNENIEFLKINKDNLYDSQLLNDYDELFNRLKDIIHAFIQNDCDTFGKRVRYLRKNVSRLSRRELSLRLHVNSNMINKYENEYFKPKFEKILGYSSYYQLPKELFMNDLRLLNNDDYLDMVIQLYLSEKKYKKCSIVK